MSDEIEKHILELQNKISESTESLEKEQQLLRLQEIAKSYSGEDELGDREYFLEQMKSSKVEPVLSTSFSDLDAILGGFSEQQLIVVSAATKSGKTSFCMDMTTKMSDQHPLWLPFEESISELYQKFLDRKEEPPILFAPKKMDVNKLKWIEKKIIEAKAKYDSKIVFIDHLHFIVPFREERQDLAIGEAMRELKRMAREWKIIIILIAHLKKTRVTEQPTLEDLRDSSFIAQEADTVIMLYRKATRLKTGEIEITNDVNVSVQANRRTGKTGNVKMVFKDGHFVQTTWIEEPFQEDPFAGDFN